MNRRRSTGRAQWTIDSSVYLVLSCIANALFFLGLCAVLFGVNAEAADGSPLKCGSALTGQENSVAYDAHDAGLPQRAVDERVAACDSAIAARRVWAWPATAVGALGSFVLIRLAPRVYPVPEWFLFSRREPWTDHR